MRDEGEGLCDAAFRTLVDTLAIPIVVVDVGGVIRYAGGSVERDFGYPPSELVGRNVVEFTPPEHVERALISIGELAESDELGIGVPTVFPIVRPDGSLTWHAVGAVPLLDDPDVEATTFFFLPWDAQLHFDDSLSALLAGEPLAQVLTHLATSIMVLLEAAGVTIHHGFDGERFRHVTGVGVPDVCVEAADGPGRAAVMTGRAAHLSTALLGEEAAAPAAKLGLRGVWVIPLPPMAELEPAVLAVWRAVDAAPVAAHDFVIERSLRYVQLTLVRIAEHAQLEHMATHDSLTGAVNRSTFHDRLTTAMAAGAEAAVLFCDLDEFKSINDRYGHAAGDTVLVEVTRRLRAMLRRDDVLGRAGGDEFTILLHGDLDGVVATAERLVAAVADQAVEVAGVEVHVGISVGIAPLGGEVTADQLMNRADSALYRAKGAGRARVQVIEAAPTPDGRVAPGTATG